MPERFRAVTWLYIVTSLVLGWALPRAAGGPFAYFNPAVGPDQVIAFLSAVSTGMMAFTGIVFSLLFILMQFSSSAYTPHLVAMLSRNPTLIHAQGVFTGTYLYTLMALRGVGTVGDRGTAGITLWVAFAWLIGSVFLLVRLVQVFASLAVSDVLYAIGDSGRRQVERLYAPAAGEPPAPGLAARDATQTVVHRGPPRYVLRLDVGQLVSLARAADAVIRIPVAVGDAIAVGTTIAVVEGSGAHVPEEGLRAAVALGRDRTPEASPKNAMRLLVDIAIRALSPAVNDPTTAVHSLDQIEDLLVRLGNSRLDIGNVADSSGTVRVVYAAPTWEEYLELGLTEIQQYGAGAVQIERRLGAVFALLRESVPAARQAALARFENERTQAAGQAFGLGPLRERAERGDRQGLGHTADLHA